MRTASSFRPTSPARRSGWPGTNYEQWLKENVPQADIRTYDDDPTKFQTSPSAAST